MPLPQHALFKADPKIRTSELVALIAVSCTLFLFLHTRDLNTKLSRLQRQNDDVTAFNHHTDSKCLF
ncbi:hypothetical protein NE865_10131 [Phthorimaea operculella]|nr:hypothetical protein NE865_10131 [Phthorimaea operculella]